jgi:hypothetical protein
VVKTEVGLLFARDDGLWVFDGYSVHKIGWEIEDLWAAATVDEWRGAYANGKVVYSSGDGGSVFVGKVASGELRWTQYSGLHDLIYLAATPGGDTVYSYYCDTDGAGDPAGIVKLFEASGLEDMQFTTKAFGGGGTLRAESLVVDMDASGAVTATVAAEGGNSCSIDFSAGNRRHRALLPHNMIGGRFSVTITANAADGGATVRGVEVWAR